MKRRSINHNARSYSPFYMRLIRHDGEQDMTKFSSILPRACSASRRGLANAPMPQIADGQGEDRPAQELASPSCPATSQIGRPWPGAGVGSVLTYVGGKLYLAAPTTAIPLSVDRRSPRRWPDPSTSARSSSGRP